METMRFLFMQNTAMLFTVVAVFVLGAVFRRGAVGRVARTRSACGADQELRRAPGGQPQRQPNPLS
jgi:hypothetical protein